MSTHKIQILDKIRKFPNIFGFFELSEKFHGDSKTSLNHPVSVLVTKVLLYTNPCHAE